METKPRPFPTAPDFAATELQRRAFRADMREAWLDRADHHLAMAQQAAGAGNYLYAEVNLSSARSAVQQSRRYAEVTR